MQERVFTRNNCTPGVNGSTVAYVVLAGTYISTVSQADADAMAIAEINAKGQNNANVNGTCGFYSNEKHRLFTKNNCGAGYISSEELYTVPARKYYSAVSQEDADAKADADINANGQAYANSVGTCSKAVVFTFWNSTSDSFGISFTASAIGYSKSYTCLPGSSSVSLPEGVYTVTARNTTSNVSRRIYVGARTAIFGSYAVFSNVNVIQVGGGETSMGIIN